MLKKFATAALAATLLNGAIVPLAYTQSRDYDAGYEDGYRNAYRRGFDDARARRPYDDRYDRDANNYRYGPPPPVGVPAPRDDRYNRWRQRYARQYSYQDDSFYQQCRSQPDPAGVIAGALIGGLLGNALGRGGGREGATIAGVIIGGLGGAALTSNLACEDRSYAYKTYYDGFNTGRPNARYQWRNPRNGHYGDFLVQDYYNDPDGFRCANYTQQIFVNGRPQIGRAHV
mgnify:CR=1 FL=1